MDDAQFFHQATLRICSSLDVEAALARSLEFLRQVLPADAISLNIYEPAIGGIRYVALADQGGGRRIERSIHLPQPVIAAIESGQRLQDYLLINRPNQDPVGRIITQHLGLENHSFIALRLFIEQQRLGVIDLFAHGQDRFTDQHARLLVQLREPFAIAMANALKHRELLDLKERLVSDNRYLNDELRSRIGDQVIGADGGLGEVMALVHETCHLKNTILLQGETGTGKEVIANAIHQLSPRRNEAFIKVNCGAIPEQLIDSELFGHEKGAFTGAISRKRGRFERAHRGTIFLDEIGELPPWAQVRLLRVLQTEEIERVGGSPPLRLDIRVIAATHRDLPQLIEQGLFRQDLWYRINMFPITIPPLRLRRQDIGPLADHFIARKAQQLGIQPPPRIAAAALAGLTHYHWPGNVRELENVIERALIQHRHGPLTPCYDPPKTTLAQPLLDQDPQLQDLDSVIRHHILRTLQATGGRIAGPDGAAALLGLHPNTLRHRMHKLGIPFGRRPR